MARASALFSVAWLLCYASATSSLRRNGTNVTEAHRNGTFTEMSKASKAGFGFESNYVDAFYMHQYVNCYPSKGAVNINPGERGHQGQLDSVWDCARICYDHPSCLCFVWQFSHAFGEWSTSRNNCFLRQTCEISKCHRGDFNTYSKDFDTFIWKR
eukprot:Skav213129  [mRNA]  locus=scaffold107:209747:210214:+ [translate_table: standard]